MCEIIILNGWKVEDSYFTYCFRKCPVKSQIFIHMYLVPIMYEAWELKKVTGNIFLSSHSWTLYVFQFELKFNLWLFFLQSILFIQLFPCETIKSWSENLIGSLLIKYCTTYKKNLIVIQFFLLLLFSIGKKIVDIAEVFNHPQYDQSGSPDKAFDISLLRVRP